MFKGQQRNLLADYIEVIRPHIEGSSNCPYVFVDGGGANHQLKPPDLQHGAAVWCDPANSNHVKKINGNRGVAEDADNA